MVDEFKTNVIDHNSDIRWISICIKLIDIIQEEDSALEYNGIFSTQKFKLIKYINIRNSYRFKLDDSCFMNNSNIYKELLRQRKALYLYNKIRYNYIFEWWD